MLPTLPDKDFFTMGEIAKIAQVPAHTLRYWESRLGVLRPGRRPGGHRRYTRADIELILRIKDLVGRQRLTLDGARKTLARRGLDEAAGRGAAEGLGAAGEGSPAASGKFLKTLLEVKREIRSLVEELSR
ncbi:MAG: MerR family transcriptional regulator [Elusimicrobia bacterium]|nr:MerR family transcriptional regulator [Elusimicrobiota bacterium]